MVELNKNPALLVLIENFADSAADLQTQLQNFASAEATVCCFGVTRAEQEAAQKLDARLRFPRETCSAWLALQQNFVNKFDWVLLIPRGLRLHVLPAFQWKNLAVFNASHIGLKCSDGLGLTTVRNLLARGHSAEKIENGEWPRQTAEVPTNHAVTLQPTSMEVIYASAARALVAKVAADADNASLEPRLEIAMAHEVLGELHNARAQYIEVFACASGAAEWRWLAAYRAALLSERLADRDSALNLAQAAWDVWPQRIEPLLILSRLMRTGGEARGARDLMRVACEQSLISTNFPHAEDDYKMHRFAELARCEWELGNYRACVASVNKYTQSAFRKNYDEELLKLRDAAYAEWLAAAPQYLPTVPHRRNRFVIIVAFRNAGAFLQKNVDSIAAQSYRNYEAIFIDDNSRQDDLADLDFSGLAGHRVIRNRERKGALANQVNVLSRLENQEDIAVFLDGDDAFAHANVLAKLNEVYNATGCWVTYGQFQISGNGKLGYARPILPDESIPELFRSRAMMFPIHLRSHRVGLFKSLLKQDRNLNCLKNSKGNFFAHASDVAHMRAMLMLAGLERVCYVSEVLYHYNSGNPESHFKTARAGLISNARQITALPDLQQVSSYRVTRSATDNKILGATRLLFISLEGTDPALVEQLRNNGKLEGFDKLFAGSAKLLFPENQTNDVFWRGIYTGLEPQDYAAHYRSVAARGRYGEDSYYSLPALSTVNGFWNDLAFDGHKVAVLNPVDVNLPNQIPGLTTLANWMIHAPMDHPLSNPPELLTSLSKDRRTKALQQPLDNMQVMDAQDAYENLRNILLRQALKAKAYKTILAQANWDLFMCGLDAPHDALHKLWHFHDQSSPNYQALPQDPVEMAYVDSFAQVTRLAETAGDCPLMVVCGLGARVHSSFNAILDQVLLKIESLLREQKAPRTIAARWFYQVTSAPLFGAVRFNLVGREPAGQVEPEQLDSLIDKVKELLFGLQTAKSQKPIVAEVEDYGRRQRGNYAKTLPDLLVRWAEVDPAETVVSEQLGEFSLRSGNLSILDYRTGDHNSDARVFVNQALLDQHGLPDELLYTELRHLVERVVIDSPR